MSVEPKWFLCPRCGNKTTVRNKETGYCMTCFSETGLTKEELRDKTQDHFEFRIRMIQKITINNPTRNKKTIQYKIEIPTSLHYRVEQLGREQEFIVHVIARGK